MDEPPDTDTVLGLIDQLPFAADAEQAAAIRAALVGGLDDYAVLNEIPAVPASSVDVERSDVTLHPDADEDPLNAFTALFAAEAAAPATSELSDLNIAIKDNVAVADVHLTCGSRVFEAVVPDRNATVVDRLLDASAELVGKTNMDELAYGPTGETSRYGPIRNPVDDERVAGGSSAGSAAAVGRGTVDAALGTDTGGSVRIPASFCGLAGFKPTWGLVPRTGVVELAYSLDVVGPIAPDVATAARVLDAISGPDRRDLATARVPERARGSFGAAVERPPNPSEMTFGVVEELTSEYVDPTVADTVADAVDRLEAAGATVESRSLPALEWSAAIWDVVTNVELAANLLLRFAPLKSLSGLDLSLAAAIREAMAGEQEFGEVVRAEAVEGTYLLECDGGRRYAQAQTGRERLRTSFANAFETCDALLSPTMPVVAPELGAWPVHGYSTDEPSASTVPLSTNVRPVNLTRLPALTLPCGTVDGLPVGLQLIGPEFEDARLLGVGRAVERVL